MDETGQNTIKAFDSYFTTDRIRMLKIMCSALPVSYLNTFALVIKCMELSYTQSLSSPACKSCFQCSSFRFRDNQSGEEFIDFLNELIPYSNSAESREIRRIQEMLQMMSRMKEAFDMINLLKELFPEGFQGGDNNPMDILSGMSGMSGMSGQDISAIFDLFRKE